MENKVFNCISILLHPIFLTTVGMTLIMSQMLSGNTAAQWVLVAFCAGYTILLPLAFIGFAKLIGYVDSIRMRRRRERVFVLVVTVVCTFSFAHVLGNWHAPVIMRVFVLATAITLTITALVSIFTCVSLHTTGWGGLSALISYLSFSHPDISMFLALAVLLSGLVATARLKLGEHTQFQVYSGFAIGFLTIWTVFIINTL